MNGVFVWRIDKQNLTDLKIMTINYEHEMSTFWQFQKESTWKGLQSRQNL